MSLADNEPIFYVVVTPAGKNATRIDATDTVMSFEFEEDEKKSDQLKLTIDNWDLSHFDNPVWRQGNMVTVTWGYPGVMAPSRDCIIQKVEGSTQITVTAQAKSLLMNRDIMNKTWSGMTRSQIVAAIAKTYGYDANHQFIQDTPTVYEGIMQARATDAQFVKRLAEAEHFEFYVDFSGFHWHPRKMGQKPLRVMQYYLPPDVADIKTWNVESDPFAKPTVVVAAGRDPLKKADVSGKGSDQDTARTTLFKPDVATGTVTEQTVTRPTTETNATQAKAEADGAFKRAQQAQVKLSLDCVGDPLVIAKSVLNIRGISKRLSGLYYVNVASHKIDSGGYSMALKVTTDSTGGHSQDIAAVKIDNSAKIDSIKAQLADLTARAVKAKASGDQATYNDLTTQANALQQQGAALAQGKSAAAPNPAKPGDVKDPNEATQHHAVDPTTGGTAVRYSPNPVAPQEKK